VRVSGRPLSDTPQPVRGVADSCAAARRLGLQIYFPQLYRGLGSDLNLDFNSGTTARTVARIAKIAAVSLNLFWGRRLAQPFTSQTGQDRTWAIDL